MAEGFKLGSAFLEIDPDTADFKPKLQAALDKDKTDVLVTVTPDTAAFKPRLQAAMDKDRIDISIPVAPDVDGFESKLDAALGDKRGNGITVAVDANTEKFKTAVDEAVSQESLKHVNISVDYNKSQLDSIMQAAGGDAGGVFRKSFTSGAGGSGDALGGPGGGGAAGLIGGLVAVGLAALPAMMGVAGTLAGVALGGALAFAGSKELQKQGTTLLSSMLKVGEQAAKVLDAPLSAAMKDISGQLPELGRLFGQTFKDVVPDIKPLVDMLTGIVENILPGLNTLIRASVGPFGQFAATMKEVVGTDLGNFFKQLAPAVGPSMEVLDSVLKIIGDLLVPIAQLADTLADGLGPAFRAIEPFLKSAFQMLGQIFQSLSPLMVLFGTVVEVLAPVSGAFVNLLVKSSPLLILLKDLNPYITQLADYLQNKVVPVINKDVVPAINAFSTVVAGNMAKGVADMIVWFGTSLPHAYSDAYTGFMNDFYHPLQDAWSAAYEGLFHDFVTPLANWFEETIPHAWSTAYEGFQNDFWHPMSGAVIIAKDGIITAFTAVADFFTQTIPRAWSQSYEAFQNDFYGPIRNSVTEATNWVRSTLSNAWHDIESDAIQGWRNIASGIGTAFQAVENVVRTPINWVLHNVIDRFDSWVNKIPGVNLPTNLSLASGGKITVGTTPTADDVPALLSKDETVVSAAHSRLLAPVFKAVGVPGFAAGGTPMPGRAGALGAQDTSGPAFGPLQGVAAATLHGIESGADALKGLAGDALKGAAQKILNTLLDLIPAGPAQNLAKGMADQVTSSILNDLLGAVTTTSPTGPNGGATGTNMANGLELYKYLLANLFNGNEFAAAGATASIWGESSWNPFAQGTGGRGLIGWTPPSTISDAAFKSGMSGQLPAILRFVSTSGDAGVIAQMDKATSVLEAANLWGKGVERYGINDVHPQGLALATSFMNSVSKQPAQNNSNPGQAAVAAHAHQSGFAQGGIPAPGQFAMVGEQGRELVQFGNTPARVYSNPQTENMLGKSVTVNLYGSQNLTNQQIRQIAFEASLALEVNG